VTCKELVAFMLDYVEGTLPAPARRRFDAHLAECADCRAYLRDYEAAIVAAGRAAEEDPPAMPDALVRAIVRSLAEERRKPT
jgi:anti-sigma factor RsiW